MLTTTKERLRWLVVMLVLPSAAHAQGTDVVEVANGDRFTGDVRRIERGRLDLGTAAAGTISIVVTEILSLSSGGNFDIELASGERLSGSISAAPRGTAVVTPASGPARTIGLADIVRMMPIADGFRERLSGSLDFGLNITSAGDARTYTLTANAAHFSRGYTYATELSFDSWLSAREGAERQTRNDAALDVRRRMANRWFGLATLEAQQDEELELDARILAGGGVGRTLIQSARTLVSAQGGVDYDAERYADEGSFDHSAEAFAGVDWDWFARGSATEVDVDATVYISLARERFRLEWDSTLRRDFISSMYWALNVFESFDSDPPDDREKSDLGVSIALGWAF